MSLSRMSLALLMLALVSGIVFSSMERPLNSPLLRIGSNVWIGYESLYLARALDLLNEQQIRLIELPSATDVSHALKNGMLEGAALTLDEVLTLKQEGVDLAIVAVLDFSAGADALVASPALTGLADLRGKRIGVETHAVGALMLNAVLERARLRADDVTSVPLTVDQHYRAFTAGDIDAVVTFEPVVTQLRETGGQVLFDSAQIPGQIVDVLVVRRELLDSHRAQIQQLLRGHFAALQVIDHEPQRAARLIAPRLQLPPAAVTQAWTTVDIPSLADNRRLLNAPMPTLQPQLEALHRLMLAERLLIKPVLKPGMLHGELLPEAP